MNQQTVKSHTSLLYICIAAITGALVGLVYLGFEWIVNNGSNWVWNDLVQTDEYRWRVIPLAMLLSVCFGAALKLFKKRRVVKPAAGLLDELEDIKKTNISDIAIILIIGALSLIAGASLGPEASLVAASMGMAAFFGSKINALKQPFTFVLSLASLGALLAAFFNSLLPVLIPLLILKKKNKLTPINIAITIAAGVVGWFIIRVIKNEAYIEIPVTGTFSFYNLAIAAGLGLFSVLLSILIKVAIKAMFPLAEKIDKKVYWLISAVIFGLVLGMLYFIGGQTVQFSGSEGLKLLSEDPAKYSIGALVGLIVVKLLATSWSTSTGYRGGLVFPSIYMGAVLSLAISTIFNLSGNTEAGTIIGSITGVLMGMTNPIIGIVLAFALFPLSQFSVVIGAVIGAVIGLKVTAKLTAGKEAT